MGNWFRTGIAPALAPTNRVIAPDLGGHGLSDPEDRRDHDRHARDVVELLDALGVERAHIGGYSMGGAITLRLLADHPERFITAILAGAGVSGTDWEGPLPPDREGADPDAHAADAAYRARRAARGEEIGNRVVGPRGQNGWGPSVPGARVAARIDLTRVRVPVMAVNGEYDRPRARTHRMWRQLHHFTNVVLPGKGHLSAIMPGFVPEEMIDAFVRFVTAHNDRAA